jgi:hypothetical protein
LIDTKGRASRCSTQTQSISHQHATGVAAGREAQSLIVFRRRAQFLTNCSATGSTLQL